MSNPISPSPTRAPLVQQKQGLEREGYLKNLHDRLARAAIQRTVKNGAEQFAKERTIEIVWPHVHLLCGHVSHSELYSSTIAFITTKTKPTRKLVLSSLSPQEVFSLTNSSKEGYEEKLKMILSIQYLKALQKTAKLRLQTCDKLGRQICTSLKDIGVEWTKINKKNNQVKIAKRILKQFETKDDLKSTTSVLERQIHLCERQLQIGFGPKKLAQLKETTMELENRAKRCTELFKALKVVTKTDLNEIFPPPKEDESFTRARRTQSAGPTVWGRNQKQPPPPASIRSGRPRNPPENPRVLMMRSRRQKHIQSQRRLRSTSPPKTGFFSSVRNLFRSKSPKEKRDEFKRAISLKYLGET